MLACVSLYRLGCLLFCGVLAIGLIGTTSAKQVGIKDNLVAAWNASSKDRGEYLAGTKKVEKETAKAAKKIADDAAEYYLYRITHRSSYKFQVVQDEFAKDMEAANAKKCDASFKALLGRALVASMKNVLTEQEIDKGDAVIVVNAAMMLPSMAKLKQDDVGNYLVELATSKNTHAIVRYYALKALKDCIPIAVQPSDNDYDPTSAAQNARRKQDAAYVDALAKFIEQTPVEIKSMSKPEIDAVRFVRREAIISLSAAGSPAVLALNKKQRKKDFPDGPVAPTLLKVLTKDGLQPPASLQEKVEAALGLCAMKHPNMDEYNPDVAAYLIGQTLAEFASEYSVDLANFSKNVDKKKPPFLPWKHDAKRLQDGLKKFADNANTPSAKGLYEVGDPVLKSIATYDSFVVATLRTQLPGRPKDGTVFKTLKTPAIPLN